MNILLGVTAIILFVLTVMESPYFFRYRSLRFVYRSGLLLYSRTFKVQSRANKFNIPRWKIEHWMVASGLSSPTAEEDGEGRYIFTEFVYPVFRPIPLLMRGKISWDNQEKDVVVRGYVTWFYFLILAFVIVALFIPSVEGNVCGGVIFITYILWCTIVYMHQMPHFNSIGVKVADYLSSDEE